MDVKTLLAGQIDKKYNDQVFWYASKVVKGENVVDIFVENGNLFSFDDVDLDVRKISELGAIKQTSQSIMRDVLISSGSLLFLKNKLAVRERSLGIKFEPGHWTTPTGRCDRMIAETGIKETLEEIELLDGNVTMLPDVTKDYMENIGVPEEVISKDANIKYYETENSSKIFPMDTPEVNLFLDGELIEKTKAWMHFDEGSNTVEFRIPIFSNLDEKELLLTDPEFYCNTDFKTIDELNNVKTVSALGAFVNEVKMKKRLEMQSSLAQSNCMEIEEPSLSPSLH